MRFHPASFLLLLLAASEMVAAEDWPRFRGPNGQGVSAEVELPIRWSHTENIAWRTRVPGNGWSSPIVMRDSIFLTSTTEEGTACHVVCVDRVDGRIRWDVEVHRQQTTRMREQNSYATPTPVSDGQRVYAVFFDGTAVALDWDGNILWRDSQHRYYSLHGLGASPTLVGDQLIMPFDGSSPDEERLGWKIPWDRAMVVSWNTRDGSVNWIAKRGQSRVGHVTPIVLPEAQQLVSAAGDRVQGHDLRSGELIWSIYSQGEGVTPSPVLGEDLIFTSSGFEEPTIRAIRMGGHDDVTNSHIAWEQKTGVPALPSPLYVAPHLYTISRENILFCIDASTGEILSQMRLSGTHSASPVFADGRIYFLSEDGETLVLRPGPEVEELARNVVQGVCKASMAVSQGNFFLRSSEYLYCIGPQPK